MQVRLKVQRIYAALILAIEAFEPETIKSEKAHEAEIQKQIKRLTSIKSWCGGFKYNEERASYIIKKGDWTVPGGEYGETNLKTWEQYSKDRKKWNRLVRLSNMFYEKEGFMVWLDESDYKEICAFL